MRGGVFLCLNKLKRRLVVRVCWPMLVQADENHTKSFFPGTNAGVFSCPAEGKLFQGIKIPPYVVVSAEQKPQHMVFGF